MEQIKKGVPRSKICRIGQGVGKRTAQGAKGPFRAYPEGGQGHVAQGPEGEKESSAGREN